MHPEENLNTEPNEIAGNRADGPVGNTATQHTKPGAGMGLPGGPPTAPDAPVTSKELADAETSPGQGAVGIDAPPQENKEVNPADLLPEGAYGGNFSNSTQGSYHDLDRRENQDSNPNRGEFGVQDEGGTTHGGFGNQNRLADYEPDNTPEDRYYGGPGAPGEQANAYRAYDGRDARSDARTEYGFEPDAAAAAGPATLSGPPTSPAATHNDPARADARAAHENDNGSTKGPGSGYAADYGHTSLRPGAPARPDAGPEADHRNQTEDYLPTPSGTDKQGHHQDPEGYSTNAPEMADQRGQLPLSSQGYGDRGREQPSQTPDMATGDARSGYTNATDNSGNASTGIGSKGGSYNDQYDDSRPRSTTGSPAKGDERTEDRDGNYGEGARQENRASADENAADHGAPQRNAGRVGEADE